MGEHPSAPDRLVRVVGQLSSSRDLPTITTLVRNAARDLTAADGGTFVLREDAHCYAGDDEAITPLRQRRRFPLHQCISGWVMQRRQPIVIQNIYDDPRVPAEAYRPTFVRSMAMVPVRANDPVAAVGAYWASNHLASDEEVQTLTVLADSASLALSNVQLYDELRASLQREQEARQIAEAGASARDAFLAVVAHELRQPLHTSLAALEVMARVSHEQALRARLVVQRQINHMARLVDDLSDASRVVRGQVTIHFEVVDLRVVIGHAAEASAGIMAERRQQLDLLVSPDPILLRADASRLQQVFVNLLSNAAKYTPPGGRIVVSSTIGSGEVRISVRDNGIGIESKLLPHLFELFTRGSTDEAGFGIGLAVVRRLVELHGGSVEARSEGRGHGSEFIVHLPTLPQTAGI